MRPREGMRYSRRTRPVPWFTILVIWPLRGPSFWVTAPMNSSGMSTTRCSMGSRVLPCSSLVMICGLLTSTSKPSRRIISMMMASWSSPRPETRKVSGESVSSTRMATLVRFSFHSRSRSWGEVTNLPSAPADGRDVRGEEHGHRRLVDVHDGQGHRPLGIGHRLPDLHVVDARDGHDVALGGLGHLHALESLVAVEHSHLGDLRRLVAMDDGHAIVLADLAVDHASADEAAHRVVPRQGGGAKLEPQVGVEAGRWNGGDQGLEEGGEGLGVVLEAKVGDALESLGEEHGESELVFRAA